ncbi:hypothetical protein QEZ40_001132 [Streptomyces katrae]|uniref:Uncharacterized protein n=1 Tax=Streptomyces katrae TaxID=68223 RepID=A0ABT7GSI2_9ACTN|nr:hypothetical protein [Streptomyces katrae]MDK9496550.1 hypothetical protein [Streptomyces katrae]
MPRPGRLVRATVPIGVAAAALCLTAPVPAAATTSAQAARLAVVHSSIVQLPLDGTFEETGAEPIHLTGSIRVRVTTRTTAGVGGTAQITSTLIGTTGIGEDTGARYRFAGTDIALRAYPPDPVTPVEVTPRFLKFYPPVPILPPNPVLPPHPVRPVLVRATIAADGTVGAVTAQVVGEAPDPNP